LNLALSYDREEEEGVERRTRKEKTWTPLHLAASKRQYKAMRNLLRNGADVDARDKHGRTPLHAAVGSGGKVGVGLLLDAGARVNARDNDGETPLHWAIRSGAAEAVDALIAAGARVNIRSVKGETALDVTESDRCRARLKQEGCRHGAELKGLLEENRRRLSNAVVARHQAAQLAQKAREATDRAGSCEDSGDLVCVAEEAEGRLSAAVLEHAAAEREQARIRYRINKKR